MGCSRICQRPILGERRCTACWYDNWGPVGQRQEGGPEREKVAKIEKVDG